jgi:nicotinamide-nucleotide amidase
VQEALEERLGDHIYGVDDEQLEGVVGALLRQHGYTLALAESCTGGLIGHRITQVPGSSEYFLLGIAAYSNEAKVTQLGVREMTLRRCGAVSPETAAEMALGAAAAGRADCALATTGIAGPSGGTVEKPVGTVWFAIHTPSGTHTQHAEFQGNRGFIKRRAAQEALILLRRALLTLTGNEQHSH